MRFHQYADDVQFYFSLSSHSGKSVEVLKCYMEVPALNGTPLPSVRTDYCSLLYMGLPLKMIQKLQSVQNVVAWVDLLRPLTKCH